MDGLGELLGGLFGDSGDPYKQAMEQYDRYLNEAKNAINPFYNAGVSAIPEYQSWLSTMKDPTSFINNIMGKYQESPYAQNLQRESRRQATNLGSASGLTGSTPLLKQVQQNASNISSGDMNQWLQNVLGINRQYGAGQGALMGQGASAANSLVQLLSHFGELMGQGAYGQRAGELQDRNNIIGGGLSSLPGLLALFG